MCVRNKQDVNKSRSPKTPRSPYRRHLSESMRLRLSRRVVPSARVNLNLYWNKFEEMSNQNLPLMSFETPKTPDILTSSLRQLQLDPVNENLINELLEIGNKYITE